MRFNRMSSKSGTTIICAAVAVFCLLQMVEAEKHETLEKCMKETGTTDDDLNDFIEGKEPSHNFKCMIKCCMQAHELISDDGVVNKNKILEALPPKYTDWITACSDKSSSSPDLCQKAYDFNHCLLESNPAYFASLAEIENE